MCKSKALLNCSHLKISLIILIRRVQHVVGFSMAFVSRLTSKMQSLKRKVPAMETTNLRMRQNPLAKIFSRGLMTWPAKSTLSFKGNLNDTTLAVELMHPTRRTMNGLIEFSQNLEENIRFAQNQQVVRTQEKEKQNLQLQNWLLN